MNSCEFESDKFLYQVHILTFSPQINHACINYKELEIDVVLKSWDLN